MNRDTINFGQENKGKSKVEQIKNKMNQKWVRKLEENTRQYNENIIIL